MPYNAALAKCPVLNLAHQGVLAGTIAESLLAHDLVQHEAHLLVPFEENSPVHPCQGNYLRAVEVPR